MGGDYDDYDDFREGEREFSTTVAVSSAAGGIIFIFCLLVLVIGCVEHQERRQHVVKAE